jgi:hypothetical protein
VNLIGHGVRVEFKRGVRPRPFNLDMSMQDATPAQLELLSTDIPRFEACGARERAYNHCQEFRMFLVPKPGANL